MVGVMKVFKVSATKIPFTKLTKCCIAIFSELQHLAKEKGRQVPEVQETNFTCLGKLQDS